MSFGGERDQREVEKKAAARTLNNEMTVLVINRNLLSFCFVKSIEFDDSDKALFVAAGK